LHALRDRNVLWYRFEEAQKIHLNGQLLLDTVLFHRQQISRRTGGIVQIRYQFPIGILDDGICISLRGAVKVTRAA
jgi:hypothetical protein